MIRPLRTGISPVAGATGQPHFPIRGDTRMAHFRPLAILALGILCSGCISIASPPYPPDVPPPVKSESGCLDISGSYALNGENVSNTFFPLPPRKAEQAAVMDVVQNACGAVDVIVRTASGARISEKTLSVRKAGAEELHFRSRTDASFIIGVNRYGYAASLAGDGTLLVQYRSFSAGLLFLVVPAYIDQKKEWIRFTRIATGPAESAR